MATKTEASFYGILGVESDATQDDIKKAYRKLAKILHPDINQAEDAEEKFKEVYEAYETLSNEEARKQYDAFLKGAGERPVIQRPTFEGVFDSFFGNKQMKNRPIRGEDIRVDTSFLISDVVNGKTKDLFINRSRICHDCHGSGFVSKSSDACKECHGEGFTKHTLVTPFGNVDSSEDCSLCNGTGYADVQECFTCEATGKIPDDIKTKITLPLAIHDRYTMVVEGQGEPGREGGRAGNLCITFHHDPTDCYRIENKYDLISQTTISLETAILGGEVTFKLPDGEKATINLGPGAEFGDRICVPDKGLYNAKRELYGNLYIELNINLPKHLSSSQRQRIVAILREKEGK